MLSQDLLTTDNLLKVIQGEFELKRLPERPLELLRAWDAADEYLLNTLTDELKPPNKARLLVFNDSFGALAVALSEYCPQAVSDSYLSQQSTRLNLVANGLPEDSVTLINSLEKLDGIFDIVLIKAPKTLALLEDQLLRLRPHIMPATKIILAGMIKGLPPSIWKLLERYIGPTTTSLARKKARLVFTSFDSSLIVPNNPYPVYYKLEASEYLIGNHANVFSRDNLDIGTRFFLQYLPVTQGGFDIIDLGCGNGLLGLIAAERNPLATIHFVDESFMAVASAKENFFRAFGKDRLVTFHVGDGLKDFEKTSVDLVICNPPFHQQNTVGDQIASSMIKESRKVLRKGGELWLIGNRHLNYHINLNRVFGNHSIVAANNKFVILKAIVLS
jgi:16S rRNA (guanine1207-N2)-methyltransferase